jgi:predicted NodU family carbamoyl transferase
MKILSINFGFNGSLCLMDNGKIIKHSSFNKINFSKDRDIIKTHTFSNFFEGTGEVIEDIDYFVFVGFDRSKFDYPDLDFVPNQWYRINDNSLYTNPLLENKPVKKLMSLQPPFTESPYDYIEGHFLFRKYVKPAYIISPDIAYTSFGYYSSEFNRSLNITVNSNDNGVYDGSLVSISKSNNISVVNRPKISVGKLYPKITELLGFGLGLINNTTIHDISTRYHIPKKLENIIDKGVENRLSDVKDNYELSFFFEHSTSQYYQDVQRHKMIPYSSFESKDINSKYVLKTAALTQRVLENTVIKLIEESVKKFSGNFTHNVVLSGDVFENRRLNTKILSKFKDISIHIAPYNKQETMSLGAAMYVNGMIGNRRTYSRDFMLSTCPYTTTFINKGDEIDYQHLGNEMETNFVSYLNKTPECTEKSMGYTGILFDVDCDCYEDKKGKLIKNLYEKPTLLIREDMFSEMFMEVPYTYDNNTVAKPKLPHLFKNFIHDDGYLNVFVVSEDSNPYLFNILDKTGKSYLGHYNFTSTENNHIIIIKTIFEINNSLGIKTLLIDDKQHIKDEN